MLDLKTWFSNYTTSCEEDDAEVKEDEMNQWKKEERNLQQTNKQYKFLFDYLKYFGSVETIGCFSFHFSSSSLSFLDAEMFAIQYHVNSNKTFKFGVKSLFNLVGRYHFITLE